VRGVQVQKVSGMTLVEAIDSCTRPANEAAKRPLRVSVQVQFQDRSLVASRNIQRPGGNLFHRAVRCDVYFSFSHALEEAVGLLPSRPSVNAAVILHRAVS
jgi:hypothetical protein